MLSVTVMRGSLPSVCRFLLDYFRGLMFNVVELYSGCVYVHVCAFYQFSSFSLFFSSLLGSMIERILVSCNNQQDLHEWVDHLQKQTKVTSVSNPPIKPHSVPSHTVRIPFFCLQTPGSSFDWVVSKWSNNLKHYQYLDQECTILALYFSANICLFPLSSE